MDGLRDLGISFNYKPQLLPSEVLEVLPNYDGLIVRTKMNLDKNVLLHATRLKFIGRAGAGMDNVDTTYCEEVGVHYFNAGEANADAVGEHTLAMLLSLSSQLQKADKEVRSRVWDRQGNTGWELKGKTVGIIGYGNTGKAVAKKLSGFEVTVLAYDKYLKNYSDQFAKEVTMNHLFEEADILSLHIPLTTETNGMVDTDWLNQFKKPIVLLNLARGKIVKLDALISAMNKNQLIGVGLDVLENEALTSHDNKQNRVFSDLVLRQNIVFSPHVGGWTVESYRKISIVLLQKIKELTLT